MIKTAIAFIFIFISITSTGQVNKDTAYIKGKDGLDYKIMSNGQGAVMKQGDFMQFHVKAYFSNGIKDSVLYDSRKNVASIEAMDSAVVPQAYFEILQQVRGSDSVVIRVLVDSVYKTTPGQLPPFLKSGDHLFTTLQLLNIFTSRHDADSARNAAAALQAKMDSVNSIMQAATEEMMLAGYFEKNKIKTIKTPKRIYINIVKKGIGNNATKNDKVKVNYTCRSFNGKVYDSNTDPQFGHVQPYEVYLSHFDVIPGWLEAFLFLNKGSKAVLYVPSAMAYGTAGNPPAIGPNEILIFDIEMLSVEPISPQAVKPVTKINRTSTIRKKTKTTGKQ